jgi:polar amino acid transport system substrate-binding protein
LKKLDFFSHYLNFTSTNPLLLLLLLSFGCFNVNAQSYHSNKPRFVTEIMSPFQLKENGKLTGFAINLMDEVISRAQLKGRIEIYPWARAYHIALTEPNVFIFTLVKTQERLEKFNWIDEYYVATDSFYALNSRKDIVINSIADAKKYQICIPRNDVGEQRLIKLGFDDSNLKRVAVQSQCLGMLQRGRVDLNLFNAQGIRSLANKFNVEQRLFKRVFVVSEAVMGVAASKNSDPQLVAQIREALVKVKSERFYEELLQQWFGN